MPLMMNKIFRVMKLQYIERYFLTERTCLEHEINEGHL